MTWAELEAKYRRLAKVGVSEDEAARIAEWVRNPEERSVSEIFDADRGGNSSPKVEELTRA